MTEKNYVVNSKTPKGTIVTVRGDSAQELNANISDYIDKGISAMIAMFEADVLSGGNTVDPIALVQQSLGATVVAETPTTFAPVPPPVQAQPTVAGGRTCSHGPMTARKGQGQKGEWKGFFCPSTVKAEQCAVQWLNRKDPEWNTI